MHALNFAVAFAFEIKPAGGNKHNREINVITSVPADTITRHPHESCEAEQKENRAAESVHMSIPGGKV